MSGAPFRHPSDARPSAGSSDGSQREGSIALRTACTRSGRQPASTKVLAVWLDTPTSAERPGDAATPPVAVVDVRVDEGLGPCEGRELRNGVAWPVGGMQDLNPVAPDVRGEPQQASLPPAGASDAGKLLEIGPSP
jgi:hypothetical protein